MRKAQLMLRMAAHGAAVTQDVVSREGLREREERADHEFGLLSRLLDE